MASQAPLPEIASRPDRRDPNLGTRMRLAAELHAWWEQEQQDWDRHVDGDDMTADDLWDCMPAVDSKAVARMAPIFKKHRHPFSVGNIRRGGYESINDVIQHLVFGK